MKAASPHLPLLLKLAFSAFLLVMVPVYYQNYGPTNFLYFCDISLLLAWMSGLFLAVYLPTHLLLRRRYGRPAVATQLVRRWSNRQQTYDALDGAEVLGSTALRG